MSSVFIGAKVKFRPNVGVDEVGFVWGHDGSPEGCSPWRVSRLDGLDEDFGYGFYNSGELFVLGDFGLCNPEEWEEHPIRGVWFHNFYDTPQWDSFCDIYNTFHGVECDKLSGTDTLELAMEV